MNTRGKHNNILCKCFDATRFESLSWLLTNKFTSRVNISGISLHHHPHNIPMTSSLLFTTSFSFSHLFPV